MGGPGVVSDVGMHTWHLQLLDPKRLDHQIPELGKNSGICMVLFTIFWEREKRYFHFPQKLETIARKFQKFGLILEFGKQTF